jgi:3-methyladenine DNA glycosylase AlkD
MEFFENEFTPLADPKKGTEMAVYLKNIQECLGIQKPARAVVYKKFKQNYRQVVKKQMNNDDYRATIKLLVSQKYREYSYAASFFIEYAKDFLILENIDLYRQVIVQGAWWDTTDYIAANYIAHLLRTEVSATRKILDQWIEEDNLWLRRTAILSQLKFKGDTNTDMLADYITKTMHEKEFFIQKAIGWVLREYSKTDPVYVEQFIEIHRDQLSKLSIREGSKFLKKKDK